MISIVMPTYNREKTIKESVDSLLNQTYKDIEIIIVDDGSTDNTEKIIQEYQDKRIKYIKLEGNKGACYARNVGIKNSNGDYVAFHDSDDICVQNKIELQFNNIIKNKSDFDFCDSSKFYENKIIKKVPSKYMKLVIKLFGYYYAACYQNYISTPCLMVKKQILKEYLFDEELPRFQDYDLIIRLLSKYKISHTKEILVKQEIQDNSITKSNTKGINAIEKMLNKEYGFKKNRYAKMFKANLYEMYAYLSTNKKDYFIYIQKSLKTKFRVRTFIKLIISVLIKQ